MAGSRAVDAYANRHRCITELSTVRCVRDKVSRSSSASTDPGRNRPGTTDMPVSSLLNVPNVKRIQHVYTDYLRVDEIKRITRRRRTDDIFESFVGYYFDWKVKRKIKPRGKILPNKWIAKMGLIIYGRDWGEIIYLWLKIWAARIFIHILHAWRDAWIFIFIMYIRIQKILINSRLKFIDDFNR